MNSRAQSLRNGAWVQGVLGLVLLVVGPTMMGSVDPFSSAAGLCLFTVGGVFILSGLVYGALSILAREPALVEQHAMPQSPAPFYPPQG